MEIEEILCDSESELERVFDDLDLYSTDDEDDDENNNSALSTRKRHAPRKWRSSRFDPKDLKFSDKASGISKEFEIGGNRQSDYFRAFFDNELMQTIVDETNKYQRQNAASNIGKTAAWYDTTMEELYVFFATAILMELNQKNRIKDYWSTDRLITTPIFGKFFTRDRYLSILRYLHFAGSNTEEEGKLRKIKPVEEYLRAKFERAETPWENLCIDEFQTIHSVKETSLWREALHVM